ncbi:hypothetical protein FVE85_2287 [Porphyridium purpureum]|uniref:Uncharacterized protein n=1 Tax=Porphyridium purpureum TaxID=35688 RepID=A0A5J4YZ69_PORPP|nr:hypothetical protein FVE85_2287 [Porphyridium purpureum]|eukprot:POR2904..scf209_3
MFQRSKSGRVVEDEFTPEEMAAAKKKLAKAEAAKYDATIKLQSLKTQMAAQNSFMTGVEHKKDQIRALQEKTEKVRAEAQQIERQIAEQTTDADDKKERDAVVAACEKAENKKRRALDAIRAENRRLAAYLDEQADAINLMVRLLKAAGETPSVKTASDTTDQVMDVGTVFGAALTK